MIKTLFAYLARFYFTLIAEPEFISLIGTYMNVSGPLRCIHGIFPKIKEQIIRPLFKWTKFKIGGRQFAQRNIFGPFQNKTCMPKPLNQRNNLYMVHPGIMR